MVNFKFIGGLVTKYENFHSEKDITFILSQTVQFRFLLAFKSVILLVTENLIIFLLYFHEKTPPKISKKRLKFD